MSIGNKYAYQTMYFKPHSNKKKSASVCVHEKNSSAAVVLQEKKVEIKDLESQVTYLQNQIQVKNAENKTLREIESRQERELKKYREGSADIPSLLRSHKGEIKAHESNSSSLRRELRDCQKELKTRCDAILRKDLQIEKLNSNTKRNEKYLQEISAENKELKTERKKLEEECKKLLGRNEELKSKSDRLQKKVQQMTNQILNLEENLGSADHHKMQLKEDLTKLQKSYIELQQNFALSKPQTSVLTVATQTENSCYVCNPHLSTRTETKIFNHSEEKNIEGFDFNKDHLINEGSSAMTDQINGKYNSTENSNNISLKTNTNSYEVEVHPKNSLLLTTEARTHKSFLLKPMKPRSSSLVKAQAKPQFEAVDSSFDMNPHFLLSSPYLPSNLFPSHCPSKNIGFSKGYSQKKL